MKWQTVTPEELEIVNAHLKAEPLELNSFRSFKRYARRKEERDFLVQFEKGVTLLLYRVDKPAPNRHYLTFLEPQEELFLKLGDGDFNNLFGVEGADLLDSTMLWAIKQANKSEVNSDDPEFGAYG